MSKGHDKHHERVGLVSSLGKALARRSGSCCELCLQCGVSLSPKEVPPLLDEPLAERSVFVCGECKEQIERPKKIDPNHWHCLHKSVWSEEPAVKVTALVMLHRLKSHDWAADLLDQVYIEPDIAAWVDEAADSEW